MKTTLYVQNLKCNYGETIIKKALSKLHHIHTIILKKEFATVTFEHSSPDDIDIVKKTLSQLGYPPFGEKNNILKKAKTTLNYTVSENKHQDK